MKKIWLCLKDHLMIVGIVLILIVCSAIAYMLYDQIPGVSAGATCAEGSKTLPVANTTFLKSFRLLVFTKINGAWPTKDGGYIVSGTTDPNIMFIPPDGFVAKLDKQGNIQWIKLLKTTNAAGVGNRLGDEDVQSIIELSGGGYLMVSKVWGFIKTEEWKADNTELNKIMFTKLDAKGNAFWSKSFTAFVENAGNSLLETADKGFLFYAPIVDLKPDDRGEDPDVYQDMPFASLKVFKFDLNGNLKWSKNIKNFISRGNDSYLVTTPDGGYALAGNIAETNLEKSVPYNYDTYPGLVKFDKNFNFEWSKSLESTPLELAAAIPADDGGFTLGWKKIRQAASIVQGLVRTPDNGYIVLGNLSSGLSLMTDSLDLKSGVPHSYLIGFKFNSLGDLEWVKKITAGFNAFSGPVTDFSLTSTADNQMILVGPMTWADSDFGTKTQSFNDLQTLYKKKYGEMEFLKEQKDKTKESQQDWKKIELATKVVADAFRSGVFMMKMDQELNITWAKVMIPHRATTNLVTKPTLDSGAIVAGEYESTDVQSSGLGATVYYKDGFLVKLDAGGYVKDNQAWLVDYSGSIVTEMMTPYAISNNLVVQVEPWETVITDRKPTFSLYYKTKVATWAPFKSAKDTLCPVAPTIVASDTPIQNSTNTSGTPRTWPQINYEKAIPVETVNEKSQTIHNELLPILNQLYNNQVKLTDNMDGAMLSYIFDRIITAEDVTAVKNYLVGIDYKIQDEGANQLTIYKPGYFLIMTFSVNNKDKAFLDVTY